MNGNVFSIVRSGLRSDTSVGVNVRLCLTVNTIITGGSVRLGVTTISISIPTITGVGLDLRGRIHRQIVSQSGGRGQCATTKHCRRSQDKRGNLSQAAGFITLSFPSGECVMKTGEGLKKKPPPAFFGCSVISVESWSQYGLQESSQGQPSDFSPLPTLLSTTVSDRVSTGLLGRAKLIVIRLYGPVFSYPIRFQVRAWTLFRTGLQTSLRTCWRSYVCQAF